MEPAAGDDSLGISALDINSDPIPRARWRLLDRIERDELIQRYPHHHTGLPVWFRAKGCITVPRGDEFTIKGCVDGGAMQHNGENNGKNF